MVFTNLIRYRFATADSTKRVDRQSYPTVRRAFRARVVQLRVRTSISQIILIGLVYGIILSIILSLLPSPVRSLSLSLSLVQSPCGYFFHSHARAQHANDPLTLSPSHTHIPAHTHVQIY